MPRNSGHWRFQCCARSRAGKARSRRTANCHRNGHLRPRQRRRRGVSRVREAIERSGINVVLASVGCFGACFQEPLVNVRLPGFPLVILHRVQANDAGRILHDVSSGNLHPIAFTARVEEWDHITASVKYGRGYPEIPLWNDVPFFKGQKKIVLRNCGFINPDDIEEYIAIGGYQALYKVLIDGRPEFVIEQIKASKLRGRGGAGYLTGNKWEFMAKAKADHKYIICNADEGDPGAYMNRNEIESDPHSLLEGMIIGAYVMGATEGIVYVALNIRWPCTA
jgi:NADH-quinone oxidoreductase subunit F